MIPDRSCQVISMNLHKPNLLGHVIAIAMILGGQILPAIAQLPPPSKDPDYVRLQQVLEAYGFEIRWEVPPVRGAYGLLNGPSKVIWINPVVVELGIVLPTLAHEAVHAAQRCAGGDNLAALYLDLEPPKITRPYYLRYHSHRRELEAEAYTVQVQPDRIDRAIALLHQHCAVERESKEFGTRPQDGVLRRRNAERSQE